MAGGACGPGEHRDRVAAAVEDDRRVAAVADLGAGVHVDRVEVALDARRPERLGEALFDAHSRVTSGARSGSSIPIQVVTSSRTSMFTVTPRPGPAGTVSRPSRITNGSVMS